MYVIRMGRVVKTRRYRTAYTSVLVEAADSRPDIRDGGAGNGVFFKKHAIINSSLNKNSIRVVRLAVDSRTTIIIHTTSEEILITTPAGR